MDGIITSLIVIIMYNIITEELIALRLVLLACYCGVWAFLVSCGSAHAEFHFQFFTGCVTVLTIVSTIRCVRPVRL
jgi:hypothetical protein